MDRHDRPAVRILIDSEADEGGAFLRPALESLLESRRMAASSKKKAAKKAAPKKGAAKKKVARKKSASAKNLAPSKTKRGLEASEVGISVDDVSVSSLADEIRNVGGSPLAAYREPLSGRPLLLASLPIKAVEPTPFQRDLSPTHVKRLAQKIEESGSFLDPLIVVRGAQGRLWTPNGRHRLAARVLELNRSTFFRNGLYAAPAKRPARS